MTPETTTRISILSRYTPGDLQQLRTIFQKLSRNQIVQKSNFELIDIQEDRALESLLTEKLGSPSRTQFSNLLRDLPSPETRPVLCAQILHECYTKTCISSDPEHAVYASPTLNLLLKYKEQKNSSLIDYNEMATHINPFDGSNSFVKYLLDNPSKISSSLLNAAIASLLTQRRNGILADSEVDVKLELTTATCEDFNTASNTDCDLPFIPRAKRNTNRLTIAFQTEGNTYRADYFSKPAKEAKFYSGESCSAASNIVGQPTGSYFKMQPEYGELFQALERIPNQQTINDDIRVADQLIALNQEALTFIRFICYSPHARTFPRIISKLDDLTGQQLDMCFSLASRFEKIHGLQNTGQAVRNLRPVITRYQGAKCLVSSAQPSTRTWSAATNTAKALALDPMSIPYSSANKGESDHSFGAFLVAEEFEACLERRPDFEILAEKIWNTEGDDGPVRLSLGGNVHHPFQTAAELKEFLRHYGCKRIDELSAKTQEEPPTIVFIGRLAQKRADMALLNFINTNLPHWNIRIAVPYVSDIPKDLPSNLKDKILVNEHLRDEEEVTKLLTDATFLYISNPEATAHVAEKGSGDGKLESPYYLSKDVVDKTGVRVFHPLPSSSEIDPLVLQDPKHTFTAVMQNKSYLLQAALALAFEARDQRRRNIRVEGEAPTPYLFY